MNVSWIRKYCTSLPGVTEHIQWGEHLVLKVAGKIFVIAALEPSENLMSFKVPKEEFPLLTEDPGIVQAPYCAKGQWVAIREEASLARQELQRLLKQSYDLVVAKLPKKTQAAIK